MSRKLRVLVWSLVAMLLVAAVTAGAAEFPSKLTPAVKVLIAEDGSPSGAGYYIADAKGYFANVGIKVEFVMFESGAKMLPAIAAGHVDLAGGITSVSLFNAVERGFDIKIVADKGTNIPGRAYYDLVIRKDLVDEIKDYSDLRGRRIAIASAGTLNEITLEKALRKGGLTIDDIDMVVLDSFADMLTAMGNGILDAAMLIEPLIAKGVEEGIVDRWRDAKDFAAGAQIAIVLASPQFCGEKREVAKRFMVAYLQGLRDYNDAFVKGVNTEEIIDIMVEYSTLKDRETWHTVYPTGLNPNGYVISEGIASDLQWYIDNGYFKGGIDLETVIDNGLVDYAIDVLGWYE